MIITQKHEQQIENIIKQMDCPKSFECYKSGFENLSEVGIVGDFNMIECIEEGAQTCEFGSPVGLGAICKCLLRNYISKNFHRNWGGKTCHHA
jgi:hypothetical protein